MTRAQQTWALAGIWVFFSIVMALLSLQSLRAMKFPDPDDAMRLLEVRDWLAGQSWFDVTQYRLDVPAGAPMHWSRLVDVPVAAVIELVRPFAGPHSAEAAALVMVPLLTLGIAMLLVQRIGLRLMSGRAALLAAAVTPLSLGALKQMRPLRIDHHGWQIVCALLAVLAALDDRPRRSGIVAGIALAVTMNISIEGLPFAAAIGALFAWQWLANEASGERLRCYLASLAISSFALFALTHAPASWLTQPRDVVTAANLGSFAAAALVAVFAVRPNVAARSARLAILCGIGIAALATMFVIDPQWLRGPFGSLDPIVRTMWYDSVDEGLPVWKIGWDETAVGLAQPLVGLIGAGVGLASMREESSRKWLIYLLLLGAVTVASLFVIRIATTASVVGLPGTAFLCQFAFRRARRLSITPIRAVATAGALFVMTPAYAVPLSAAPVNNRLQNAFTAFVECNSAAEAGQLRRLPAGNVAALLNNTPAILVNSQHRAIASGHHRNMSGIRDVIELFMSPTAQSADILMRRHIDYLVFCPGAPEAIRYSARAPQGLAATLRSGNAPAWLEPVQLPQAPHLRVWRFKRDATLGRANSFQTSLTVR